MINYAVKGPPLCKLRGNPTLIYLRLLIPKLSTLYNTMIKNFKSYLRCLALGTRSGINMQVIAEGNYPLN